MAVMDLDALEVEFRNVIKANLTDSSIPVFPDFPRIDISKSSLPRVSVQAVPAQGQHISLGLTLTSQKPLLIATVFVEDGYTDLLRSLITEIDGILDANKTSFTNAKVLSPLNATGTELFEFEKFVANMRTTVWEAWVLSN